MQCQTLFTHHMASQPSDGLQALVCAACHMYMYMCFVLVGAWLSCVMHDAAVTPR